MTRDRLCADGGLLVDGNTRLSADPCEYYDHAVRELVGCSRLRCRECGSWVRGGPPGVKLKENVPVDLALLFATANWVELAFVEQRSRPLTSFEEESRLYACRCRCWEATRVDRIDNEHDSPSDPNVPWECAGHPLPELPGTLGELIIGSDTDWPKLVDAILAGGCPRQLKRKDSACDGPGVWLVWLYVYLEGLSLTDQLSAAIAARVGDSDPHVVGRVVHFFTSFPRAQGVEHLIARAEADLPGVAVGYPIPEHHRVPALWDVLIARLEKRTDTRVALDLRAEELVRRVLVLPLASLSHEHRGPTDLVELERQRRMRFGSVPNMDDYAQLMKRERTDVVANELGRSPGAFDNPEMRVFIAEHLVEIDAAAKGRWRQAMTLLTDFIRKPEEGHLIVIAGVRVIEAGLATPDELRAWVQARRSYGWVDDSWVLPLEGTVTK